MKPTRIVIAIQLLLLAMSTQANTINYSVENLAGNRWQYSYEVDNDGAAAIDAFAIIFDLGLYENLAVTGSPADWDSIELQPDAGIPDDGYFDTLALGLPLGVGEMLGGFSIAFDFLGAGTPGSQLFEIFDPFTFDLIAEGETMLSARPPNEVAEPGFIALAGIGFALLMTAGSPALACLTGSGDAGPNTAPFVPEPRISLSQEFNITITFD